MSNRGVVIGMAALNFMLQCSMASAAGDSLEVGAGYTSYFGAKLALGVLHEFSPAFGITANLEWSQRPWIIDGADSVDRRLAYGGVGGRLRMFPSQRVGAFTTFGLGVGRLSFPGSSTPEEWHAVPWTGLGLEGRIGDHLYVGAEARIEWLRRNGSVDGELPLRITARVPFGAPAER